MRAVFLDRNTFSPNIELAAPDGVSDWVVLDNTKQDIDVIAEALTGADIAVLNKIKITGELLDKLPDLKLIQITATGKDNVDIDACEKHGVDVQNVAGYSTTSVTEHTFMLILSAMRSLTHYHQAVSDGRWQQDGRFSLNVPEPIDIADKTLGIIGAGTIGQEVAKMAQAFGMKVLYAEHQGRKPRNSDYTAFDEVLAQSDIISLHCPLTEETANLINKDTLGKMQQQPLLVNVARGGLVDSQAVVNALNNEQLFGYVCDVFAPEPPAQDEPLLTVTDHPRVIYTPHNAWASCEAQQKLWRILRENVAQWINEQF